MPSQESDSHIVITGPMGSGKTTVGKLLADRTRRPFVDSDAQLEDELDLTAREIARRGGVDALHRMEADALRAALERDVPSVIAAAASIGDLDGLEDLLGGDEFVVLLTGEASVLRERASTGSHRRPVSLATARELAARRQPKLDAVADFVVDVTSIVPEEVTARVMKALSQG